MVCPRCGCPVGDGSNRCPYCGSCVRCAG
ncbi:MAG: zinc-ribbon domain-containing protein, partial [Thermoplasmatota archaeon]